jgi:hypothetical protein
LLSRFAVGLSGLRLVPMKVDLDDLPPRVAQGLTALAEGDELILVQQGAVVACLQVKASAPAAVDESGVDPSPEERMKEVLDQFNAMIHDEF